MSSIASQATNKIWETLKLIPCNFFKATASFMLYHLATYDVVLLPRRNWNAFGRLLSRCAVHSSVGRSVGPSVVVGSCEKFQLNHMRVIGLRVSVSEWMSVWLLLLPRGQSKTQPFICSLHGVRVSRSWLVSLFGSVVRLSWVVELTWVQFLLFSWVFGFRFWVWLGNEFRIVIGELKSVGIVECSKVVAK